MTRNSSSDLPSRLDYFTLRFWQRLPAVIRKLLLLRSLLQRAVWLRALLGGLLVAQLRLGSAWASGSVFTPSNPFVVVNVADYNIPDLVDIDGDGDLDAFIGEESGNIFYFENTGSASSPTFALVQTNPFGLADVGVYSAPSLVDIDGDGDLDAFVGEDSGNIFYFENTGSVNSPAFASVQTNPFGLTDMGIGSDLTFVDIDGDGDLDAFVGGASGNLFYFANTGDASSPAFALVQTNPFGLADVGSYSSPAFVDIDGDSDLDVFAGIGGASEPGSGNVLYFENTGSSNSPAFMTPQTNPFGLANVGFFSNPTLVDINGDGDLDAFIGEEKGNLFYFDNTGSASNPAFALIPANPFGLTDVDPYTSLTLVDIDGDGDLDAFTGRLYSLSYFANTGDASSPAFAPAQIDPFGLAWVGFLTSPAFGDIDGDGDFDAFVGERQGDLFYFANTGNATNPAFAAPQFAPFGPTYVAAYSNPTLVDIDGDSDLDIFLTEDSGLISYFENTGSANSPAFASVQTNPFGLTDVGYFSSPTFADIDGDGDLDALIGEGYGSLFYFANTGSVSNPAFAAPQTNPFGLASVGYFSSPALGDIDSDGDLDAFIGEGQGDIAYFRNGAVDSLALVKSASASQVTPGQVLTYTLSIRNNTTTPAMGAAISDTLPAGLTFKGPVILDPPAAGTVGVPPTLVNNLTISPGQRITVTFPVTVNAGLTNGTVITNTATVTSTGIVTPATGTNAITIVTPGLSLAKSASASEIEPGQVLTYTLVVFNNAAANALDAAISDILPAGLTFKGPVSLDPPGIGTTGTPPTLVSGLTISAGQRITVTFPVTVNASLANGALITNTAAVTSSNVLTPATGSHVITVTVTINGTEVRLPIILKSQ